MQTIFVSQKKKSSGRRSAQCLSTDMCCCWRDSRTLEISENKIHSNTRRRFTKCHTFKRERKMQQPVSIILHDATMTMMTRWCWWRPKTETTTRRKHTKHSSERERNNEMCVKNTEPRNWRTCNYIASHYSERCIFCGCTFSELHFAAFFVDLGFHTLNSASCLVNFFLLSCSLLSSFFFCHHCLCSHKKKSQRRRLKTMQQLTEPRRVKKSFEKCYV